MVATVVLISGANQGIGYQIALNLAKQQDYHVVIGSRKIEAGHEAAKKIATEGGVSPVEAVQLDITDDASIAAAVKTIEEKFGHLDVLVVRDLSHSRSLVRYANHLQNRTTRA
jgi:NAD(P)-dependent dehydrogenase (short-subunit alcohol dehydrogenase family)